MSAGVASTTQPGSERSSARPSRRDEHRPSSEHRTGGPSEFRLRRRGQPRRASWFSSLRSRDRRSEIDRPAGIVANATKRMSVLTATAACGVAPGVCTSREGLLDEPIDE